MFKLVQMKVFFWHRLEISFTIPIPSLHFSLQPSVQHSSQTAFYISKEIFEGCRWWYRFLLYLFIKRSRKQERARVKFIWNSWSDAQLVTFLLLLAFLKVLQERLNHCQLACLPYLHVFSYLPAANFDSVYFSLRSITFSSYNEKSFTGKTYTGPPNKIKIHYEACITIQTAFVSKMQNKYFIIYWF